jgi:hypothetical protein
MPPKGHFFLLASEDFGVGYRQIYGLRHHITSSGTASGKSKLLRKNRVWGFF